MFALMLPAVLSSSLAAALTPSVETCETEWRAGNYDASIAACTEALHKDPKNIEALWRKARSIYSKGEILASQGATASIRIRMYSEVTALGEAILAIDPSHGLGLHWKGAGLGRTATAKGVLSSLFMADDIEDAWLAAIEDDYRYRAVDATSSFPADTYYALGQYYRLLPDSSLVKLLTGTRGDIDRAISWLRKGVADSPQRIEMLKELGVSLLCKAEREGNAEAREEGLQWLAKAEKLPNAKGTDPVDKAQIPVIRARPDDACGYSRDGWQDVSSEAVNKLR